MQMAIHLNLRFTETKDQKGTGIGFYYHLLFLRADLNYFSVTCFFLT